MMRWPLAVALEIDNTQGPCPSRYNSNIPTPRITSQNMNGLSCHYSGGRGLRRHIKVINSVKKLLAKNDIVCLQETKLPINESSILQKSLGNWKILYSNKRESSAGCVTLISPFYQKHFDIHHHINSHPSYTNGHILCVTLVPKHDSAHFSHAFQVINLYLTSGNNSNDIEERAKQLEYVTSLPSASYNFAVGDFNFVENDNDTTSLTGKHRSTERFRNSWADFTSHFRLTEIFQPIHTYYRVTNQNRLSHTSRLDRIYTSHPMSDHTVLNIRSYIHRTNNSVAHAYKSALAGSIPTSNSHFTDHLPISLTYSSTAPGKKKRSFSIPDWLARNHNFLREVEIAYAKIRVPPDPFEKLALLKRTIIRTAKKFFTLGSVKSYNSELNNLSILVSLLRLCTSDKYDIHKIIAFTKRHPETAKLIDINFDFVDTKRLSDSINSVFSSSTTVNSDRNDPTSPSATELEEELSQPSQSNFPKARPFNLIREIKTQLPNTRKRLTHLRTTLEESPTSNTSRMEAIVDGFWGDKWKNTETANHMTDSLGYLEHVYPGGYTKTIPEQVTPEIPEARVIDKVIRATNDSAPGPDGIPFLIYRALRHLFTPILSQVMAALASGVKPPKGFNKARLFLIPKNESMLIEKTRPISVTNCDNRIIASAVAEAIGPACDAIIHRSQKGFIPGRNGDTHIVDLNRDYYKARVKRIQHYILFMDTEKAFDSVHHSFIFAVLKKAGFPSWVSRTLGGLMDSVTVLPVLGAGCTLEIAIERGVKQGCPLSPLLFALCYDPLLEALDRIDNIRNCAFADDLAISSPHLRSILKVMKEVDRFASHSGLRVNTDKTKVLRAIPTSPADARTLASAGWKDTTFSDRETYLGVLMGNNVTTIDVFDKAYDKYIERLKVFYPALRRLSIDKRILTVNVFLVSVFMYLAKFYYIPYREFIAKARDLTRRTVISFNGGGFGYAHLISADSTQFKLANSLKDLWALNLTHLALKHDLKDFDGRSDWTIPGFAHVDKKSWGSLLIEEHQAHAAHVVLADYFPKHPDGTIDASFLSDCPVKNRRLVYRLLVDREYEADRAGSSKTALANKLQRLGVRVNPNSTRALHINSTYARPKFRAYLWNIQYGIIMNSLATDCRLYSAGVITSPRSNNPSLPFPCYLCGQGKDKITHIYSDCKQVNDARLVFYSSCGIPHSGTTASALAQATLTYQPTGNRKVDTHRAIAAVAFNWAVWRESREYLASQDHLLLPSRICARLVSVASMAAHSATSSSGKPKSSSKYGSAGRRTPAQRAAVKIYVDEILKNIHPDAVTIFTDGSALGNPGPSGAGVFVQRPANSTAADPDLTLSAALGKGTNNTGELYAIGVAIEAALREPRPTNGELLRVTILSDSNYALGCVFGTWESKTNAALAQSVKDILLASSSHLSVSAHWVPGHCGVLGNELADRAAVRGSLESKRCRQPDHIGRAVQTARFYSE